jgi:hypothetical protein
MRRKGSHREEEAREVLHTRGKKPAAPSVTRCATEETRVYMRAIGRLLPKMPKLDAKLLERVFSQFAKKLRMLKLDGKLLEMLLLNKARKFRMRIPRLRVYTCVRDKFL